MADDANQNRRVRVVVSEDRLKAWVKLQGANKPGFEPPNEDDMLSVLEAARIDLSDTIRKRVAAAVAKCAEVAKNATKDAPVEYPDGFLIAEGRPPVCAEDGRFEWSQEFKERLNKTDDADQIDYFSLNAIVTVEAGTSVGFLISPKESSQGVDVYGNPLPPRKPKGVALKLGSGLKIVDEKTGELVAETPGRIATDGGRVRLHDVLEIPGDVDFESGSVDAVVDVAVRGSIRSNFKVLTTKSLTVERVIEAAEVEVGGDVSVRGGVFGHDGHGSVKAGGDIAASFFNETRIDANGTVRFAKEVLNSRVRAFGQLIGEHGTIIGGNVWAREGIEVRVIGSDAGVATVVAVGTDVDMLRRTRQMEKKVASLQRSAEQIRQAVAPLIANLKRLGPGQRERATELMSKADEIDLEVSEIEDERQKMLRDGNPEKPPFVLVNEVLYPGTRLLVGAREARFQRVLHGPVKVELRKVKNATALVAVNQRTGSVTVLPAIDVDLDQPPSDEVKGEAEHESKEPAANNRRA